MTTESDKIDFRLKSVRKDSESLFTLIKGTVYQVEISILNFYTPNRGAPNYIKKTLMDLNTDKS
jgi:hypothetical protein